MQSYEEPGVRREKSVRVNLSMEAKYMDVELFGFPRDGMPTLVLFDLFV